MIGSSHLPPGDSGDGRLKDEEISRRGRQRVHNRYSLVPGRPSCWRPQLQRPPRTPWPPRHCGWTFPLAERPPRVAAPRHAISLPRWSRLCWATLRRLGPGRRFGGPGASRGDTAGAVCRAFDQRTCPRSEVLVSANTQLSESGWFTYGDRAARLADRGTIVSDRSLMTRSNEAFGTRVLLRSSSQVSCRSRSTRRLLDRRARARAGRNAARAATASSKQPPSALWDRPTSRSRRRRAASNAVLEMRESPERDRNVRSLLVSEQHASAETVRRLAFDASAW